MVGSYVSLAASDLAVGGLRTTDSGHQLRETGIVTERYEVESVDLVQPSRYRACNDTFHMEQESVTYCTLTACDSQGNLVRIEDDQGGDGAGSGLSYSHVVDGRCQMNTLITRSLPPQPLEEKAKNDGNHDQYSFIWYPGQEKEWNPMPDCQRWFFDNQPNHMHNTINQYLMWKIPTVGVSSTVYYNQHVKGASYPRNPKTLYIYAAHTETQYHRDISVFNLRAVRETFGDDAFIIFSEIYHEANYEPFMDYVDVFLHSNFSNSQM